MCRDDSLLKNRKVACVGWGRRLGKAGHSHAQITAVAPLLGSAFTLEAMIAIILFSSI